MKNEQAACIENDVFLQAFLFVLFLFQVQKKHSHMPGLAWLGMQHHFE
ncbi:hypothetical protein O2313_00085 [Bacillus amyloliquefaciens]|nr:hypothetical protein [Bacillus amyloliquefaciens]MCZ4245957.1 hypothetical protein [Bacillus amyloliquefaciens]